MKRSSNMSAQRTAGKAVQVADCILSTSRQAWDYATSNQAAIDDHWQRQTEANSNFFNGPVWLATRWTLDDQNMFRATFLRTEFKAYLYWRWRGFEDAGVWDAFGTGLVCSRDGGVLLGEQGQGHVNAGQCYPPAGFIDDRDINDHERPSSIDIRSSVARELEEETGLTSLDVQCCPGYWLTQCGRQISIACVYKSRLSTDGMLRKVSRTLAQQDRPELTLIHMVHSHADLARLRMPPYARCLLDAVLKTAPVAR